VSVPDERLVVEGVSKAFRRRGLPAVEVLDGLDFSASPGDLVAVMGASGSGKSTLLHLLGGMLAPDGGRVVLAGTDPWSLGADERAAWRTAQVGFVFQAARLLTELTALENVLAPGWIAGVGEPEARAGAEDLLRELGLGGRLHHYPSELSGGEAQRVAVARALARSPRLVLADEPTGNLDRGSGARVFEEFTELQARRRVIALVATHDDRLAARCARVVEMRDGKLA
jgi:ABC-type lipoprotein export system ATPase subunit